MLVQLPEQAKRPLHALKLHRKYSSPFVNKFSLFTLITEEFLCVSPVKWKTMSSIIDLVQKPVQVSIEYFDADIC